MTTPGARRISPRQWALAALCLLCAAGFVALGVWQVERRAWKLDLIARVEAGLLAEAGTPPGPDAWNALARESAEYRRVRLTGAFDNARETLVQAVSDYGAGFWVLTPFLNDEGFWVLVNRGFVSSDARERTTRRAGLIEGPTTVSGLIRMSEPKGAFLRENDPATDVWRSRDVPAIAEKRGLEGPVAPYFVDADARPNAGGWPIGGLTIVSFRNNHLVYALTWFSLAIGSVCGAWVFARGGFRRPRKSEKSGG